MYVLRANMLPLKIGMGSHVFRSQVAKQCETEGGGVWSLAYGRLDASGRAKV